MIRTIVTSILVAGLALGTLGSASAGKGGNSGKTGSRDTESPVATLFSTCDSMDCYERGPVQFWGDGYDAAQGTALLQIDSGYYSSVGVDSDGSVDFSWNYFQMSGDHSVQLYQNGKGRKLELKAETTIRILPE